VNFCPRVTLNFTQDNLSLLVILTAASFACVSLLMTLETEASWQERLVVNAARAPVIYAEWIYRCLIFMETELRSIFVTTGKGVTRKWRIYN
jgi:hypothetical protein